MKKYKSIQHELAHDLPIWIMGFLCCIFAGYLAQRFLGPDATVGIWVTGLLVWVAAVEWDMETPSPWEIKFNQMGKSVFPIMGTTFPCGMIVALYHLN